MTLLVTVLAAVISTVVWYMHAKRKEYNLSLLCWLFWGASLMWLVDAIFEYAEEGAAIFEPAIDAMMQDLFLGLSVLTLALVIWVITLLIKDPNGVIRVKLTGKK